MTFNDARKIVSAIDDANSLYELRPIIAFVGDLRKRDAITGGKMSASIFFSLRGYVK
jgi:hypothetical protein